GGGGGNSSAAETDENCGSPSPSPMLSRAFNALVCQTLVGCKTSSLCVSWADKPAAAPWAKLATTRRGLPDQIAFKIKLILLPGLKTCTSRLGAWLGMVVNSALMLNDTRPVCSLVGPLPTRPMIDAVPLKIPCKSVVEPTICSGPNCRFPFKRMSSAKPTF